MGKKYCYDFARPAYTADVVIIHNNKILLIKRAKEPFKDFWALPGGFMDIDETPEDAAIRELFEETSLKIKSLKQFRTYGALDRDPRHRTITTVFYKIIKSGDIISIKAGDDAKEAKWHSLNSLKKIAFDHKKIINEIMIELGI